MAAATLLSGIAVAAVIAVGCITPVGSQYSEFCGLVSGRLIPFVIFASLVAQAQLCATIYWYRKRSRRDFAGRYRRWFTASLFSLGAAACHETGVHQLLGRELSLTFPPAIWNTVAVCWIVPTLVLMAFLVPALVNEMKSIAVAAALFVLGSVGLVAMLGLQLVGSVALPSDMLAATLRIAFAASLWCILVSTWWHARHVVWVDNEPPPPGQLGTELKRFLPRPKLAFLRRRTDVSDSEDDIADVADERAEKSKLPKRRKRKVETADTDAVEPRPSLLGRFGALVLAPFRGVRSLLSGWSRSRHETRERKLEEKRRRREERARNAEKRQQEKAERRAAAAEAKLKPKKTKAKTRAATPEPTERPAGDRIADDEPASVEGPKQTAAERRAERKAARQRKRQEALAVATDESDEAENASTRQSGKRRKRRR